MSRVLDYIASQPWGITEAALDAIFEIAARETRSVEAIERELGRPLDNTRTVRVREGVAVIPVSGPLFRYANLFTRISGATSYEALATDLGEALRSSEVRGIVFDVDSPGGVVNGNAEISEMIYQARALKPTAAFVSGLGASAAYWLATSAERVIVSPTAILGSVGTVIGVTDDSARDAAQGIRSIEFVSSQSPKKRLDPFSEDRSERAEAHSQIQIVVDDIAQVFVESAARNMGVSVDHVLAEFGRGGVLVGQRAVEVGMAHSVGTLEDVISQMQDRRPRGTAGLRPAVGNALALDEPLQQEQPMSDKAQEPAAEQQPVIDRANLDANHADLVAAIRAEGATNERERIAAIRALPGSADVKTACIADGITAGEAAIRVLAAQKATEEARSAAHLAERAGAEAELDAPAPSADVESNDTQKTVQRILAVHRSLKGDAPAITA